jgi:hypothetical protein
MGFVPSHTAHLGDEVIQGLKKRKVSVPFVLVEANEVEKHLGGAAANGYRLFGGWFGR